MYGLAQNACDTVHIFRRQFRWTAFYERRSRLCDRMPGTACKICSTTRGASTSHTSLPESCSWWARRVRSKDTADGLPHPNVAPPPRAEMIGITFFIPQNGRQFSCCPPSLPSLPIMDLRAPFLAPSLLQAAGAADSAHWHAQRGGGGQHALRSRTMS